MFEERLDRSAALSGASCPRCGSVGLQEIDSDTYSDTAFKNVHKGGSSSQPSLYARCAACSLVMQWPGCYSKPQAAASEPTPVLAAPAAKKPMATAPDADDGEVAEAGWWGVSGRISRSTFFLRFIACIVFAVVWVGFCVPSELVATAFIGAGAITVMYVFQAIKRAHDFGVGTWSVFLVVIPLINTVWFLVLLFVPGTPAANRHGPRTIAPDRPVTPEYSPVDRERDRARLVAMMNRDTAA